ncbi:MAG: DUF1153 domain-containing protein [Paracoccaceae bacterium]|nr:DUF1153 domain-containing protein [Paracoccaceae bacterium]
MLAVLLRKISVVGAVAYELLSAKEASSRDVSSEEEFESWVSNVAKFGRKTINDNLYRNDIQP